MIFLNQRFQALAVYKKVDRQALSEKMIAEEKQLGGWERQEAGESWFDLA